MANIRYSYTGKFTRTQSEMAWNIFMLMLTIGSIVLQSGMLLSAVLICSNLLLMHKVRKNQSLFLVVVFMLMYSMPFFVHYLFGYNLSGYKYMNKEEYIFLVLLMHTIFYLTVNMMTDKREFQSSRISINLKQRRSKYAYYFGVAGCFFCLVFGLRGANVLSRGGYTMAGSSGMGALYEYCPIFYVIAYFFCGDIKFRKISLQLIFILYAGKCLLYGGRVPVISMGILFFMLFYSGRYKTRTIMLGFVVLYIGMAVYGDFRDDLHINQFSLSRIYGIYDLGGKNSFIGNNETDCIYAAICLVSSVKTGFVDLLYRAKAAVYFIIRFIVPSSMINQDFNVIPYLQRNYTSIGGGGLVSAFWYFYFGWIGVILAGMICGKVFSIIGNIKKYSSSSQIFALISLSLIPRWLTYSPEAMIKLPLYAIVVYFVMWIFFRGEKTRRKSEAACKKTWNEASQNGDIYFYKV